MTCKGIHICMREFIIAVIIPDGRICVCVSLNVCMCVCMCMYVCACICIQVVMNTKFACINHVQSTIKFKCLCAKNIVDEGAAVWSIDQWNLPFLFLLFFLINIRCILLASLDRWCPSTLYSFVNVIWLINWHKNR